MTLRYVGQYSGYLPKETGQVVAFVRKKDQFTLNEYVQWVSAPTPLGLYKRYDRDGFVRLVSGDRQAWEDGNRRPVRGENKLREEWDDFRCQRKSFDWTLGYLALENTKNFELKPAHMAMATSQAVTELTDRTMTLLQAPANWPTTNTADANTLNGGRGKWSAASDDPADDAHYNAIFLTLTAAADTINLYTNGRVMPGDLRVILSPTAARKIAATPEITNYCRESPAAKEILEKGLDSQYSTWGLPKSYKGFQFCVEAAPKVSEYPTASAVGLTGVGEATTNRTRMKNDTTAIIVSRPGGLDGEFGTPSFSTVQLFHHGSQVEVEAFDKPEDRLVDGHVTTHVAVELAAGFSGFLITSIL
jgi:hypothetical protein